MGWDLFSIRDDSLAIILVTPTTSTEVKNVLRSAPWAPKDMSLLSRYSLLWHFKHIVFLLSVCRELLQVAVEVCSVEGEEEGSQDQSLQSPCAADNHVKLTVLHTVVSWWGGPWSMWWGGGAPLCAPSEAWAVWHWRHLGNQIMWFSQCSQLFPRERSLYVGGRRRHHPPQCRVDRWSSMKFNKELHGLILNLQQNAISPLAGDAFKISEGDSENVSKITSLPLSIIDLFNRPTCLEQFIPLLMTSKWNAYYPDYTMNWTTLHLFLQIFETECLISLNYSYMALGSCYIVQKQYNTQIVLWL